MMIRMVTDRKSLALAAGLLALASQGASGENAPVASHEATVITVTAPRQDVAVPSPQIEADMKAVIEALNRTLALELEQSLKAMEPARIELAMAEVPTRG